MRYLLAAALITAAPISVSNQAPSPRFPLPVSHFPIPDTLSEELRRDLDPWLDERAKSGAFSGVILIAKNGTLRPTS